MKTIGLFSGVGGIELGFQNSGFDIIWSNEIDEKACKTNRLNFPYELTEGDIEKIQSKDIPNHDVLLAGFPCQAFSLAGYRKGFADERGNVFFQVARVLRDKRPNIVFLENVKNLVGHDKGNTFRVIIETLEAFGYHVKHKVLNAMEYGNVPQNRERIYIIGFQDKNVYEKFSFPNPIPLTKTIRDIIDYNSKMDDKFYYTKEKSKFYDELKSKITNPNTLYQWRRVYVRENKSGVCPTLTANMGTGGHNVPLVLTDHGIRKLTPRECFSFQGFQSEFLLPDDVANSHLYKQAGNSVVVPVIKRIADNIQSALNDVSLQKGIFSIVDEQKEIMKTPSSIQPLIEDRQKWNEIANPFQPIIEQHNKWNEICDLAKPSFEPIIEMKNNWSELLNPIHSIVEEHRNRWKELSDLSKPSINIQNNWSSIHENIQSVTKQYRDSLQISDVSSIVSNIDILNQFNDIVNPLIKDNFSLNDFVKSYKNAREFSNNYDEYLKDDGLLNKFRIHRQKYGEMPDIENELKSLDHKQKQETETTAKYIVKEISKTKDNQDGKSTGDTLTKTVTYANLAVLPLTLKRAFEEYQSILIHIYEFFKSTM